MPHSLATSYNNNILLSGELTVNVLLSVWNRWVPACLCPASDSTDARDGRSHQDCTYGTGKNEAYLKPFEEAEFI
jgi:hypothetical protein